MSSRIYHYSMYKLISVICFTSLFFICIHNMVWFILWFVFQLHKKDLFFFMMLRKQSFVMISVIHNWCIFISQGPKVFEFVFISHNIGQLCSYGCSSVNDTGASIATRLTHTYTDIPCFLPKTKSTGILCKQTTSFHMRWITDTTSAHMLSIW